jgi:hypothetical protein
MLSVSLFGICLSQIVFEVLCPSASVKHYKGWSSTIPINKLLNILIHFLLIVTKQVLHSQAVLSSIFIELICYWGLLIFRLACFYLH